MTRYKIIVEVSLDDCYDETEIIDFTHHSFGNVFDDVTVKNIEKISISPEEAIKQIQKHIDDVGIHTNTFYDIQQILNKVQ